MDQHSLAVLEFGRLVDLVRARAPSSLGSDALAAAGALTDPQRVRARLRETSQMRALRERNGALPWDGSRDITPHLERLRAENAWVDGPPLVQVAEFATACGGVARAVLGAEGCPDLAQHAEAVPDLSGLAREIRRCLTPEGEVRDDASEELLRLRSGIGRARREVVGALERMMGDAAHAQAIQEPIVTLREDRYVIPVKTGGRGAVPGIVHDRSASGQTVFVEPQAVVELNNALREQILAEREETRRILRSLSDRVRRHAAELRTATAAMAQLEAIWARAVHADEAGMVEPRIFEESGRLDLVGARHPLLLAALGERTVPIDLAAGGETRTLVVTGPNTGGKTVALKTAGLLCLMAQSGMHVPAEAGTGMSCFDAGARGHRGRAVDPAEPLDLLRARQKRRRDPRDGRTGVARAPRRAGRRHRPRGGSGARRGHSRRAAAPWRADHRDHPPQRRQGLRGDDAGGDERGDGVRRDARCGRPTACWPASPVAARRSRSPNATDSTPR